MLPRELKLLLYAELNSLFHRCRAVGCYLRDCAREEPAADNFDNVDNQLIDFVITDISVLILFEYMARAVFRSVVRREQCAVHNNVMEYVGYIINNIPKPPLGIRILQPYSVY